MYKLIVGLGNFGDKYHYHRHNFGFLLIDAITLHFQATITRRFNAEFIQFKFKEYKIILLKPQTYMNNSGIAVNECVNFYKIAVNDTLVMHDELDLDLGKIKIKFAGSSGGHNGVKSIDQYISNQYWRLRLGISKPLYKAQVADYVLSDFQSLEMRQVNFIITFIINNFELLLNTDYNKFSNNYSIKYKEVMELKNEF